jgi:hypothetical protein
LQADERLGRSAPLAFAAAERHDRLPSKNAAMKTQGDIARAAVLKRGLIYFGDVLDEVRALPDPEIRAVVAVAAAHRLVQDDLAKATADAVTLECVDAVDAMWALLGSWGNGSHPADLPWKEPLDRLEESEAADIDLVAATIYAGRAIATGEPEAAVWAVSRLIDDRFASLESRDGFIADFEAECAAQPMQEALQQIRANIRTLLHAGLREHPLAELRRANGADLGD